MVGEELDHVQVEVRRSATFIQRRRGPSVPVRLHQVHRLDHVALHSRKIAQGRQGVGLGADAQLDSSGSIGEPPASFPIGLQAPVGQDQPPHRLDLAHRNFISGRSVKSRVKLWPHWLRQAQQRSSRYTSSAVQTCQRTALALCPRKSVSWV